MIERASRLLTRGFEILIAAALAVMGILVFGNVVLRYVFNSGIAVSEELSRLLFVWLIFLGAVIASAQRAHIGFDTLVRKSPPWLRKILVLVTGLLMLVACGIFIQGGWKQTVINLGNSYPVLEISYAWLYGVAVVFGCLLIFPVLHNMWLVLSGRETGLTEDLADRIGETAAHIDAERGQ